MTSSPDGSTTGGHPGSSASARDAREQHRRPTGQFGVQPRAEVDPFDVLPDPQASASSDPWETMRAAHEQALAQARAEGVAEGRAAAFEEAANLIHDDAGVASALTGHVMRHPEGAWQITVPDECGYEMTDTVLAAASVALRARAAGNPSIDTADNAPLGGSDTCPTCGGHGYGREVGPAAGGGTLRSGECLCCFGTGTIPNTGSTRRCDSCAGSGTGQHWHNGTPSTGPCEVCGGAGRVPTTALGQAEVVVPGHGRFGRISTGSETGSETEKAEYWAREPYAFRIEANRPLTDDEIRKAAGLFGYSYRAAVAGEPIGEPRRDSDRSFIVAADTTKSSRDDLGMALDTLVNVTPGLLREGSPVRKTDRAGIGTAGTRLIDGFNEPALTFALYADDYDE